MSPPGRFLKVRRNKPLPLAATLPAAVFPPREHLIHNREGKLFLRQLNRSWPVGDEIDWQLNDDSRPTQLECLALHYLEFVESVEVELGESILLNWIRRNPPWQSEYWLNSWNSYAISIRTVCMMQWLAAHRAKVSPNTVDKVVESVAEQVRFLARNLETDIRGNHLIKNIKTLLWAAKFFHGPEASAWYHRGRRFLRKEVASQFLSDGMHFEMSPAYHCQVFADLLECASILVPGERSELIRCLEPAAQVIADLTHPDGRISLYSDGGLNMTYLPKQCLSQYEQFGGPRIDQRRCFGFEDSGYYGIRTGQAYLTFDCGPSCADTLPAHGHGDILAFEWDVDGRRIVVDAGVREYESGPERDWNRSTKAHNTVTVGNRDQCEFVKSFRVGHRAHGRCLRAALSADSMSVTGSYSSRSADGQQINHTRTISGSPEYFRVVDHVTSRFSEPAVARLLLHHDCDVYKVSEHDVDIMIDTKRIHLNTESPVHIRTAKWSPDFGTEFKTVQLEIEYGNTPCESGFTLTVENESHA